MPSTTGTFQYESQWRAANARSSYPFAPTAALSNGKQFIPTGLFVDAAIYVVGGRAGLYLSSVLVAHDAVTVAVGDDQNAARAVGTFDPLAPPTLLNLSDAYGRPAGLLVAAAPGLGFLAAWGAGTYAFTRAQAEFVASVCFPQPAPSVRGVRLADGTVLAGEVWLVGDDGIVLRHETASADAADCSGEQHYDVVRVDAVGDPLFRRRLCTAGGFVTPAFIKTVTFKDGQGHKAVVTPDAYGNVSMSMNNRLAADTALRVRPTAGGNRIDLVGSALDGRG